MHPLNDLNKCLILFYIHIILIAEITFLETVQILPYTDDTSMTLSVASSLANKGEVNAEDMAER